MDRCSDSQHMWEEEEEGERGVRRRQRKAEEDRERGVEDGGNVCSSWGALDGNMAGQCHTNRPTWKYFTFLQNFS